MIKLLFVCTGNICRSPLAQGIFTRQVSDAGLSQQFVIDSAGTHAHFAGNAPDPHARAAAGMKGIDISRYRSRRITAADFLYFDRILAADHHNMVAMNTMCRNVSRAKLELLMTYAGGDYPEEIPDPYGGGMEGFVDIVDRLEKACRALLASVAGEINVRDR